MRSPDTLGATDILPIVLGGLVVAALAVPVAMALWFAPALVALRGSTAIDAAKLSFRGCMQNVVPFLIYGLLFLLIVIAASIPLMLGWLLAGPVLFASVFTAYRDIYPIPVETDSSAA